MNLNGPNSFNFCSFARQEICLAHHFNCAWPGEPVLINCLPLIIFIADCCCCCCYCCCCYSGNHFLPDSHSICCFSMGWFVNLRRPAESWLRSKPTWVSFLEKKTENQNLKELPERAMFYRRSYKSIRFTPAIASCELPSYLQPSSAGRGCSVIIIIIITNKNNDGWMDRYVYLCVS